MNERRIKEHLRDKVDEWINTLPFGLRGEVIKNCFVTGGSIVSLLLGDTVNDYDIYFTKEEVALKVASHYAKDKATEIASAPGTVNIVIRSSGIWLNNEKEFDPLEPKCIQSYEPRCITGNAISLNDKVQLITKFVGTPDEVHKNFDFVHCTCYYEPSSDNLVIPVDAAVSMLTKELKYQGSLYPLASIIRTRKFIKRGWSINAGQYLKMILQLQGLNLYDLNVLKGQLMGVDSLYFNQMLQQVSDLHAEDGQVDALYLVELIDRFF